MRRLGGRPSRRGGVTGGNASRRNQRRLSDRDVVPRLVPHVATPVCEDDAGGGRTRLHQCLVSSTAATYREAPMACAPGFSLSRRYAVIPSTTCEARQWVEDARSLVVERANPRPRRTRHRTRIGPLRLDVQLRWLVSAAAAAHCGACVECVESSAWMTGTAQCYHSKEGQGEGVVDGWSGEDTTHARLVFRPAAAPTIARIFATYIKSSPRCRTFLPHTFPYPFGWMAPTHRRLPSVRCATTPTAGASKPLTQPARTPQDRETYGCAHLLCYGAVSLAARRWLVRPRSERVGWGKRIPMCDVGLRLRQACTPVQADDGRGSSLPHPPTLFPRRRRGKTKKSPSRSIDEMCGAWMRASGLRRIVVAGLGGNSSWWGNRSAERWGRDGWGSEQRCLGGGAEAGGEGGGGAWVSIAIRLRASWAGGPLDLCAARVVNLGAAYAGAALPSYFIETLFDRTRYSLSPLELHPPSPECRRTILITSFPTRTKDAASIPRNLADFCLKPSPRIPVLPFNNSILDVTPPGRSASDCPIPILLIAPSSATLARHIILAGSILENACCGQKDLTIPIHLVRLDPAPRLPLHARPRPDVHNTKIAALYRTSTAYAMILAHRA
ncbi:hypothetical protein DFH06DRAFT_1319495 [Mycena polygramma]|nr:hypothetical protein DFH06DRAFT_1319495 [Mycena polygramma]